MEFSITPRLISRDRNLKTFSSWSEGSLSPFLSMDLQDKVEVWEFVRTEVYKAKVLPWAKQGNLWSLTESSRVLNKFTTMISEQYEKLWLDDLSFAKLSNHILQKSVSILFKLQMFSVHPCNQALRKPPTELGSWGRTKARLKSLIIVTTTTALATEYCFAFGGRLILPSESKHSHLQAELRGSNVKALHCPDEAIFSQAWLHLWSESKS